MEKSLGKVKHYFCEDDLCINGKEVYFYTMGIKNSNDLEENIQYFYEIVDKYFELNEIVKKAIIDSFDLEEGLEVKYFFSEFFRYKNEKELIKVFGSKYFEEINIKSFIEKIQCNMLLVDYTHDDIQIRFSYIVPDFKKSYKQSLYVFMNKEFNVCSYTAFI